MSLIGNAIAEQNGEPSGNLPQQQKPASPAAMVRSRSEDFFKVLPGQVEQRAWLRMAEAATKATPEIERAALNDRAALMRALLECARLGHIPGTDDYYLTVRSGKIQGAESYKGMIQRILRSGQYVRVVAEVVYDSEYRAGKFQYDRNVDERPRHEIDWAARDGSSKPIMSYAYAVRADGTTSEVKLADPRYLAKVRAQSRGKVWEQWDEIMVLKTAIRMLIDFVDTSSEDRRSVGVAAATDAFSSATTPPPSDPNVVPNQAAVDAESTVIEGEVVQ
ncbi:RecT-like ssDNA annealing protein [Gordonia phage Daredevil]|uniref:RecT-like DNA pairing protein n=1 Tax=Gordonia phage Daredevil TaxID=2283286 RepID=A0A345MIU0_9CAUD|nr:RecT-like ssDNA annealing protein [Gordonia phage Daredevil]AXH70471.1 RecT-like DNA pairing protein [Gordonia phage Daredevil]